MRRRPLSVGRGRGDGRQTRIEIEDDEPDTDDPEESLEQDEGEGLEVDVVEDSQEIQSPARKRRRISVSPELGNVMEEGEEAVMPESSPGIRDERIDNGTATLLGGEHEDDGDSLDHPDAFDEEHTAMHEAPTHELPPPPEEKHPRSATPVLPSSPMSSSSLDLTQKPPLSRPAATLFKLRATPTKIDPASHASPFQRQQPLFILPSREAEVEAQVALGCFPQAFSPQRRGAKYLAGGMAAEVQGWLSGIKGSSKEQERLMVRVEEVRCGGRMYLVRGRKIEFGVGTGGEEEEAAGGEGTGEERGEEEVKVVLAGEGRLTGLGGRAVLPVGSVVEVGEPTWGVEIEGGKWIVGCDWKVQ